MKQKPAESCDFKIVLHPSVYFSINLPLATIQFRMRLKSVSNTMGHPFLMMLLKLIKWKSWPHNMMSIFLKFIADRGRAFSLAFSLLNLDRPTFPIRSTKMPVSTWKEQVFGKSIDFWNKFQHIERCYFIISYTHFIILSIRKNENNVCNMNQLNRS